MHPLLIFPLNPCPRFEQEYVFGLAHTLFIEIIGILAIIVMRFLVYLTRRSFLNCLGAHIVGECVCYTTVALAIAIHEMR